VYLKSPLMDLLLNCKIFPGIRAIKDTHFLILRSVHVTSYSKGSFVDRIDLRNLGF
jgi:hypothetical protein